MSLAQAAAAAVAVFPDMLVQTRSGHHSLPAVMVAVAYPQSRWEPSQVGDPVGSCPGCYGPNCHGYTSWGLWQIHNSTQPFLTNATHSTSACTWQAWLLDPVHNAQAAYWLLTRYPSVTQGLAVGWGGANGDWDTDLVESVMAQAEQAVSQARAAHAGSSSSRPPKKVPSKTKSKTKPTPRRTVPTPSPWPWVALGSGALGLSIFAGWEWHRDRIRGKFFRPPG